MTDTFSPVSVSSAICLGRCTLTSRYFFKAFLRASVSFSAISWFFFLLTSNKMPPVADLVVRAFISSSFNFTDCLAHARTSEYDVFQSPVVITTVEVLSGFLLLTLSLSFPPSPFFWVSSLVLRRLSLLPTTLVQDSCWFLCFSAGFPTFLPLPTLSSILFIVSEFFLFLLLLFAFIETFSLFPSWTSHIFRSSRVRLLQSTITPSVQKETKLSFLILIFLFLLSIEVTTGWEFLLPPVILFPFLISFLLSFL